MIAKRCTALLMSWTDLERPDVQLHGEPDQKGVVLHGLDRRPLLPPFQERCELDEP